MTVGEMIEKLGKVALNKEVYNSKRCDSCGEIHYIPIDYAVEHKGVNLYTAETIDGHESLVGDTLIL